MWSDSAWASSRMSAGSTCSVCPWASMAICLTEASNVNGALTLTRSGPGRPAYTVSASTAPSDSSERCVTSTPLGSPVDPDV